MEEIQEPARLREEVGFEFVARRDPVAGAEDGDRRVEVVEAEAADVAGEVVEEPATLAGVASHDDLARLLDGFDDFLVVERDERACVNDFYADAVLGLEQLRRLERAVERGADGEDGEILAFALDVRLAERDLVAFSRDAALVELLADVVDALALEEDHRVGAVERGGHEALGVVRCGREHDLEPRHLCAEGGPVLRVLGAVFGADGDAYDDGHLEDACRHGLPFRELVEDFVACASDEVCVHELNQRAAAAHGVADRGADDGGFGDGGVEEAVVGDSLGEAAVDGERAAPVAVFLAVCDERGILVELVEDRLEESVAKLEDLVFGDGLTVRAECEALLLGDLLHARVVLALHEHVGLGFGHLGDVEVGVDELFDSVRVLDEVHARRELRVDGELDGVGDRLDDVLVNLVERGFGGDLGVDDFLAERVDGVDLLPRLFLLGGAVGVGIRGRVAGVAVCDGVEQDGATPVAEDVELAAHSLDDCERVVAVDALGVHLLGVDACADARGEVIAHRLAACLTAHCVLVVHDVDHDWEAALHVAFPQRAELVHGRERHAFPDGAAAHGAVSDVADDDARLAVDLLVERGADGYGAGAADDGVVGVDAEGEEKGVHGAAEAAVEAGVFGENLRERAVHEELHAEFLDGQVLALVCLLYDPICVAVEESLHDGEDVLVLELVDCGEALGEDFAVAAVRTEDVVLGREEERLADCRGLLAHGEVRGAGVVVLQAVVSVRGLDRV